MACCPVVAFEADIEGFVQYFSGQRIHWQRNTRISSKQVNCPFMRQHIVNQRFNAFRRNIIYQKDWSASAQALSNQSHDRRAGA